MGDVENVEMPEQGATSQVWVVNGPNGRFVVKGADKPPCDDWLRW